MIVAAVLFAAIAAALVFVALQNRGEGGGDSGSAAVTSDVVVAARDIPANTKLTAEMLEVRAVPIDTVLAKAYTSTQEILGLPTRFPVEAGEQVTRLKVGLTSIEDEKDVALVLEPGKRGFAVQVTEVTGVGGLLLPGNFVDVIAVFPEGPARRSSAGEVQDIQDIKAVTLLQNVEVLAVAQEAQEPVPAVASDAEAAGSEDAAATGEASAGLRGQRPENVERQPQARSVTLAVAPQEAQLLALVQDTAGVIWLSLRPVGDHESLPATDTNILPLLSSPPAEAQQ